MKPDSPLKTDSNIRALLKSMLLGFCIVIAGIVLGYTTRVPHITETAPGCTTTQQRDCLRSVRVDIVDIRAAASLDVSPNNLEPLDRAMNLTVRFPDGSVQRVFVPDGENQVRLVKTVNVQTFNGVIVAVDIPGEGQELTNKQDNPLITNISMVIILFGAILFINIMWQIGTYNGIKSKGGTPAGIPKLRATLGASLLSVVVGMLAALAWVAYLPRDAGFVWLLGPFVAALVPIIFFYVYFTRKITGRP